jgi:nitrogen fixation/metabolism regulation signal transduction histidine kinase
MAYRHFRANCVARILFLAATISLLIYLLLETSLAATSLIVAVAAIIQIALLIHYIERTNRDLSRFLSAIKYSDFSQSFSRGPGGSSFDQLNAAFDEVIVEFQRARAEKEEQYRYLQTVVHHVGLGLLAFDQDGEVDLINNGAKRLLKVSQLKNIKSLAAFSRPLVDTLFRLRSNEKALVKIEDEGETLQLVVYATEFRLRERSITLVSMYNIQSELAEQEMVAWQKLIRVLTHEIMNSVTPIASLASTVNNLITRSEDPEHADTEELSAESKEDIRQAAATIEKRTQGLLRFIDAYRNLTRIPKPNFQIFTVAELLDRVTQLMIGQIEKANIELAVEVDPESLELTADRGLIEQVLINLILNAIHASRTVEKPSIRLESRLDERGRVTISVADNGPGILDEVKEKIFTPFFTTRQEGSGIGLSLSRQIMRLHKGTITFQSTPQEKTVFTLRF